MHPRSSAFLPRATVVLLSLALCFLHGCGGGGSGGGAATAGGSSTTSSEAGGGGTEGERDPVAELTEHMAALMARSEHDATEVEVQHILVAFRGALSKATRSREEALALAADLFARVRAGEGFDALVEANTDDSYPGIYTVTTGAGDIPKGLFGRSDLVPAFGDVGWRLEVGEVGVSDYDPETGPFGYHLIKRLR